MADKAISELVAAEQIKSTDMFVLEQDGTAKRLQGQTLLNWLTAAADGHGGISNIAKTGTDGLVDTYTITLADTTTQTFTVTNGNGLTAFEKLSTVGLVDTYRFTRSDGTYFTFAVANGAKGDTGEASHVWIKYASQQPTADSHSMGDLPDAWMGVYSGTAAEAPDDWQQYTWYQIKGEKGDTGAAATVTGTTVEYMVSDSGTIVPSGSWSTVIPTVPQGKYLWTKVTTTFNTGSPAVSYSVTRMGIDGAGSVSSVNEKSPGESGNVSLLAEDIPTSGGGSVQAVLDDKQEALTAGENISISGSVIATKAFPCNPNLLDNWYFGNPVNQRGQTSYPGGAYAIDRWLPSSGNTSLVVNDGFLTVTTRTDGAAVDQIQEFPYPPGTVLTLSALMRCTTANAGLQCRFGKNSTDAADYSNTVTLTGTGDWELVTLPLTIPSGIGAVLQSPRFRGTAAGTTYDIKAIKLELGTQQTLAHQENGVWVLNEIPDYSEQYRRCLRYFQSIQGENFPIFAGEVGATGRLYFTVPLIEPMRSGVTVADVTASDIYTTAGRAKLIDAPGYGVWAQHLNAVTIWTAKNSVKDYTTDAAIAGAGAVCLATLNLSAELSGA